MTIKVRHGGATREITSAKLRHLGITRTLRTIKVHDGTALRTVFTAADPITAVASPEIQLIQGGESVLTSANVTVTPTGGTAPYSYSWAVSTFTGNTPTISNPGFATTYFTQTLTVGEDNTCTFTCTVTDALGNTANAFASVNFLRESGA